MYIIDSNQYIIELVVYVSVLLAYFSSVDFQSPILHFINRFNYFIRLFGTWFNSVYILYDFNILLI